MVQFDVTDVGCLLRELWSLQIDLNIQSTFESLFSNGYSISTIGSLAKKFSLGSTNQIIRQPTFLKLSYWLSDALEIPDRNYRTRQSNG